MDQQAGDGEGPRPRVLVDATAIPADRGGVGRYLDALLPELDRLEADLVVVCQARDAAAVAASCRRARVVPLHERFARRAARLVWEQVGLPRLARRASADVIFSPHYTMPLLTRTPVVVTLHDATFFSHPELHTRTKRVFFRTATRIAVRRARALVVPSQATRDEVVRFTGARPDRFTVALHGVDPAVFHPVGPAEANRVAEELGLAGRSYVAFLGTLEPRKNVPALIRGWVTAVRGTPEPPALVLAGGPGWDDQVEPAIAQVPAGLDVLRTGYLPLEDLAGLLAGAQVVAYPSRGEGFGLPVLEAMACGAAVLTSAELSLTEVGGDAVAYCGTSDAEIGQGLRALLADPGKRSALGAAALERARQFTWASSARAHLDALRSATRRT
jgi:glycosyltransferase involved in cell wall biosynthesis